MKIRLLTLTVVFAGAVLASSTAEAAHRIYRRGGPIRVIRRPVVVVPVYPVWTPATTFVSPNMVIGPRGRIRYVAPRRTIVTPVYVW